MIRIIIIIIKEITYQTSISFVSILESICGEWKNPYNKICQYNDKY